MTEQGRTKRGPALNLRLEKPSSQTSTLKDFGFKVGREKHFSPSTTLHELSISLLNGRSLSLSWDQDHRVALDSLLDWTNWTRDARRHCGELLLSPMNTNEEQDSLSTRLVAELQQLALNNNQPQQLRPRARVPFE